MSARELKAALARAASFQPDAVFLDIGLPDMNGKEVIERLRLRSEAGENAIDAEGGIELPYPLTRQDIADMSGNTLHTVSRIMAAWESQGVLGRGRRKVVIADLDALKQLAGSDG